MAIKLVWAQAVCHHRHSICSSSGPSFLPPGQKLMCILEPSCPLGSNSFLGNEDKKEKLKGPAPKALPGRRKFLFLGIIFLLGTLACFPLFSQMHGYFFTSRQRETERYRQRRKRQKLKERRWTAKGWRTIETGRKMQRKKNPKEYVRYTEKEEPLSENCDKRDLHSLCTFTEQGYEKYSETAPRRCPWRGKGNWLGTHTGCMNYFIDAHIREALKMEMNVGM